jgi:hypothetical protein
LKWLKQSEIDARARKRIAAKLSSLIRGFDGSPADAKEPSQKPPELNAGPAPPV